MTIVAIPDHLCAYGQWSEINGFPPSYYVGEGKECSTFIRPVQNWCSTTLGYSPPLYWGSDMPVEENEESIEERSWFARFESNQDVLLFKMRWLDRSVPFSDLVAEESIEDLRNSVQARIKHVRSSLG